MVFLLRIIKNLDTEINLDAVPYMMTLDNQQFAQAYANVYTALAIMAVTCRRTFRYSRSSVRL